ncbi:MAG: cob(I)yrinic acid a,c-diamide adenosyltransferase [Pseudomonadota bacterium]
MVVLNKIYTRTGDDGTTALGSGERVSKADLRVTAYGTVDETNSVIGIAIVALQDQDEKLVSMLRRIQNDLFDAGADLCLPDRGEAAAYEPLRITPAQVERLEQDIDRLNGDMDPLKSFILPGGTMAAAFLHQARTVCRRAERIITHLSSQPDEPVSTDVVKYINRLSDFLFVAARCANDNGRNDILWVPGQNRE